MEAQETIEFAPKYTLCSLCDHFVDENYNPDNRPGQAKFIHLEDGEQEFDHEATPSGETKTLLEWKKLRPDLFQKYPDGGIGPNSSYHPQRGKLGKSYVPGQELRSL